MSNIKFIYFDIGGVLINWRGIFHPLARQTGKTPQEAERIYIQYDEIACRGILTPEEMGKKLDEDFEVTNDQKIDVMKLAIDNFRPIKESHDFIARVIKSHRIGLLTNVYYGVFDMVLRHGFIPNLPYHVVVQSCHLGLIKPEKEIFHHAQKQAGVPHENILFIDDYEVNVQSARELGWQAIHFDTHNPKRSLKEVTRLLNSS